VFVVGCWCLIITSPASIILSKKWGLLGYVELFIIRVKFAIYYFLHFDTVRQVAARLRAKSAIYDCFIRCCEFRRHVNTLPSWASILHYVKQTLHWQLSPFQDVLRPWWSCINNHFLVFYVYNCIISRNFCVLVSGIIYYYHRSVSWLQSRRTEARYRLQFSGLYLRIAVDYSISLSVSVIAPSFFCSNKWI